MIQGEGSAFELVRCEDDAAWLEERKKGVGGSDVAAIMGISPWKTPFAVWLEKTGRAEAEDISDKPYVRFGNIMEPLVAKWYQERFPYRKVRRVNAICRSIERPWAQASLDYEVKDGDEWGVLEIKTARSAKDWQDGAPTYYLTQVLHYLSVIKRPFADIAVFFRDTCEFQALRIRPDAKDLAAVESSVDTFWNDFVLTYTVPALDGDDSATLADYYGLATEDFAEVDDYAEADALIDAYQKAADAERQYQTEKREAAAKLMGMIGAHKGLSTDVARVTWVRSEREVFDSKRFAKDHPDLWAEYTAREVRSGGIRVRELAR